MCAESVENRNRKWSSLEDVCLDNNYSPTPRDRSHHKSFIKHFNDLVRDDEDNTRKFQRKRRVHSEGCAVVAPHHHHHHQRRKSRRRDSRGLLMESRRMTEPNITVMPRRSERRRSSDYAGGIIITDNHNCHKRDSLCVSPEQRVTDLKRRRMVYVVGGTFLFILFACIFVVIITLTHHDHGDNGKSHPVADTNQNRSAERE